MRRAQFPIVDVRGKSSAAVFEDSSPETAWPLELKAKRIDSPDPTHAGLGRSPLASAFVIDPLDPILFVGGEPLDPSTVRGDDFELRWVQTDERGQPTSPRVYGEPIPLRARLSDNSEATGVQLELHPMRPLSKGLYQLRVDLRELRLRDFGGNRPWIRNWDASQVVAIRVVELGRQSSVRSFHESFFTTTMRSTAAVPHADGTAHWGETGRVEITYPAAAGRGFDGAVVLGERETRSDIHATSLSLPEGVSCDLAGGPGVIVLRAQGRLVIDGTLRRLDQSPIGTIEGGATLSDWLETAKSEAAGWTVLIAGGDLVVSGRIDVRGPLLLVCGGRIRVSGSVSSRQEEGIYTLGEGGGGRLIAREAPLDLDSPRENPLVEPLTFAVLSTPIPPRGGVRRWRAGARSGGYTGAGSYSVRFLSDDAGPLAEKGDLLEARAVDDPAGLEPSSSLILWIELTILPGLRWDPPWVDFVEVEWDPLTDSEQP
jgi:hypothetical protein